MDLCKKDNDKYSFSPKLSEKIALLKKRRSPIKLGNIDFASPLLLAPMSAICSAPYRLLMEELGAGGTVSELISCHGINYGNEKTLRMLKIHPEEKHIGLQIFGEDKDAMAKAAIKAQESNPKFIDINMGCPVRKVVTKGGGSALLKDTTKLGDFFKTIKDALEIPLTIKIRTGWDEENLNAKEVIHIAKEEGVEFVAIHGRTRTQQYKGFANWNFLEDLASESPLPLIGNGDLHDPITTKKRLDKTNCDALMLGRGPLRNPFLFLETYIEDNEEVSFCAHDYYEVTKRLYALTENYVKTERTLMTQIKKHVVWMSAGFPGVAQFRGTVFQCQTIDELMGVCEDYFLTLGDTTKKLSFEQSFMAGGHG